MRNIKNRLLSLVLALSMVLAIGLPLASADWDLLTTVYAGDEAAAEPTNVALNKPVSVNNGNSLTATGSFDLSYLNDGDAITSWHSHISSFTGSTPEAPTILTIDLQGWYDVSTVNIYPSAFANYAAPSMPLAFTVELLNTAGEWVEVAKETECYVGNSTNENFVANHTPVPVLEYPLSETVTTSKARIVITADSVIAVDGWTCTGTTIGDVEVLGVASDYEPEEEPIPPSLDPQYANVAFGKTATFNNGNSTEAYSADGWGVKALTDGKLDYGAWLGNFNAVYTSPENPTILTVDLAATYDLSYITINPYGGTAFTAYIMPFAYTVEVWDVENQSWVVVGEETACYANNGANFTGAKTPYLDYKIDPPIAASKVRMVITQDSTCNIGTPGMLTAVGEIQALAVLAPVPENFTNIAEKKPVSVNNGNTFFNNYDTFDLSFITDGDPALVWHSAVSGFTGSTVDAPTILTVDLQGAYEIGSVKVYPAAFANYAAPTMPLDYTVQVLTLDGQWVTVGGETDCYVGNSKNPNFVANFPATEYLEYRLPNYLKVSKARIVITKDSTVDIGGSCNATNIGELVVLGTPCEGATEKFEYGSDFVSPEALTSSSTYRPGGMSNSNQYYILNQITVAEGATVQSISFYAKNTGSSDRTMTFVAAAWNSNCYTSLGSNNANALFTKALTVKGGFDGWITVDVPAGKTMGAGTWVYGLNNSNNSSLTVGRMSGTAPSNAYVNWGASYYGRIYSSKTNGTSSASYNILSYVTYEKAAGYHVVSADNNTKLTQDKAHVILLAGQSNATGISMNSKLSSDLQTKYSAGFPNVQIAYYSDNNISSEFVPVKLGQGHTTDAFGPEVGLADYLNTNFPGEKFYIIKATASGTNLYENWRADDSAIGAYYQDAVNKMAAALKVLENQGLDPEIFAFMWMQGESDANVNVATARAYMTNLDNMYTRLKARFTAYQAPGGMALIDAGIFDGSGSATQAKNYWHMSAMINGLKATYASANQNVYYLDTNALDIDVRDEASVAETSIDYAHYDADDMIELGKLFGAGIKQVIDNAGAYVAKKSDPVISRYKPVLATNAESVDIWNIEALNDGRYGELTMCGLDRRPVGWHNNASTFGTTTAENPIILTIKLNDYYDISTLRVMPGSVKGVYNTAASFMPAAYYIQVFDGAEWQTVASDTGVFAPDPATVLTYDLETPVTANQVRMVITSESAHGYTIVGELEACGVLNPDFKPAGSEDQANNIAFQKPVTSTNSLERVDFNSAYLTDGDLATGWHNANYEAADQMSATNPTRIVIDLENFYDISKLTLYPLQDSPYNAEISFIPQGFDIQVSNNGQTWTTIKTVNGASCTAASGESLAYDLAGETPIVARWIRLNIVEESAYGAFNTIGEIRVEGTIVEGAKTDPLMNNIALNKDVAASDSHEDPNSGWGAIYLTDGVSMSSGASTGWHTPLKDYYREASEDDPFYITINLGRKYSVSRVSIYPVVTYNQNRSVIPRDFDIEYSLNGSDWFVAAEIRDASCPAISGAPVEFDFNPVDAVLIRLKITKHSDVNLYTDYDFASAISEIEVYGTAYKINVPADQILPEDGQAGLDSGIVRDENSPKKYVTLRFDDCTTQDAKIVEILKKYGVYGATFYLNTGLYGTEWDWVTELTGASHIRYTKDQLAAIYTGFDIGVHGYEHLSLKGLTNDQIKNEVQKNVTDIAGLSFFGKTPVGMAYAGGTSEVTDAVRQYLVNNTSVRYGMGTVSTHNFALPETFMKWEPTAYFNESNANALIDQFIQTNPTTDMVLTLWGHGYEFDQYNSWDNFEAQIAKLAAAAAEEGSEIVFVTNAQFYQLFKNEIPAMPVEADIDDTRPDVIDMVVTGDGYDIYNPPSGADGYRYGAQYLYEDDGLTVHAYFSCIGASQIGEWDWIAYRKSTDGGKNWSAEKMVLSPSMNTTETYSVCDPGVVKAGDYYYIAYTSTLNALGMANNVYIARSKNPDGPFDKWTGDGWGGAMPAPIFYCDDAPAKYGIGEPAMVVKGDTMYLYYTYIAENDRDYCMVATADLTTENWPATIQEHGVATRKINSMFQVDSLDVKYVEDLDKFIAVATGYRFTPQSLIAVYESNDGIHFDLVDVVRQDTYDGLHNIAISSGVDGHINTVEDADLLCVVYSYAGSEYEWGVWATRVQPIAIGTSKGNNIAAEIVADNKPDAAIGRANEATGTVMIRLGSSSSTDAVKNDVYAVKTGSSATANLFTIAYSSMYKNFRATRNTSVSSWEITVGDPSIISVTAGSGALSIQGLKAGTTYFDVTYSGHTTRAWVVVTDTEPSSSTIMSLKPVHDQYTLYWGDMSGMSVQLRAAITYTNYTYMETGVATVDSDGNPNGPSPAITFSGYDTSIITVDANGFVTPVGVGTTTVTMTCLGKTTTVPVTVSIDAEDAKLNLPGKSGCQHRTSEDVVVAPTCTQVGFTSHTCKGSNCGYSWIDTIVPATGHTAAESTYDPATGIRTYGACSACGTVPANFVTDWSQNVGVKVSENLKMYFYAWIDKSVSAPVLKVTRDGRTYTVAGSVVRTSGDAVEYVFAFEGVTPNHADTALTAELFCDGNKLLTKTCSLKQYIDDRKDSDEITQVESNLLGALDAYFAALENAQTGATNDVVIENFTNVTATDKKVTGNGTFATFQSATVGFGNDIRIRFTLTLADGVNASDLTFKVKVNGGAEIVVSADYITVSGNTVQIYTDAIAATNLDDVYTVSVYNGETAGATFDYSVKSYVYAFQSATGESEDHVMLVKALYNYGLSAKAFADAQ